MLVTGSAIIIASHKDTNKSASVSATRNVSPNKSLPHVPTADELAQQDAANASSGTLYPCINNVQDRCISTPSADFYPVGSEGATNPDYKNDASQTNKEIAGRITASSGNSITIHTTSGRDFTINYPLDAVANFNDNHSQAYKFTVGIGDELYVRYSDSYDSHSIAVTSNQIIASSIVFQGNAKVAPLTKY